MGKADTVSDIGM